MAKKKRRSKRSKGQRKQSAARTAVSSGTRQTPRASKITTLASLKEEYRYVVGDLKRMGILAAAMFVLMVVLALVIR